MWSHDECIELIAAALRDEESRLRDEQAVYGLDALDEVGLHPLIAHSVAAAGLGILREQPYPSTWKKKTWRAGPGEDLPLPRERERCDLVLTEHPGVVIADEVRRRKHQKQARAQVQGTLFEQSRAAEQDDSTDESLIAGRPCIPAADAMWLEVKALGQYEYADGVPSPNPSYASRLMRSVLSDVGKLAGDPSIVYAASLIILFTADETTAEHDLLIVAHRCLDQELPIATPIRRAVPILDRIGNTRCNIALFPVKR